MMTGSNEALKNAMNKYRVYAKKETKAEFSDYLINHTSVVYVMGADGAYLSSFAHSTSPDAIKSILLKVLQNYVSLPSQ
jgi:cytochrome oxidase Cu insertion factor (SCO1/SenC/PrrC family)